jgi:hypothetical protein
MKYTLTTLTAKGRFIEACKRIHEPHYERTEVRSICKWRGTDSAGCPLFLQNTSGSFAAIMNYFRMVMWVYTYKLFNYINCTNQFAGCGWLWWRLQESISRTEDICKQVRVICTWAQISIIRIERTWLSFAEVGSRRTPLVLRMLLGTIILFWSASKLLISWIQDKAWRSKSIFPQVLI